MTRYWGDQNPFTGESGTGQPGTGPDLAERLLILQRVRDGIAALPADSTEGSQAA